MKLLFLLGFAVSTKLMAVPYSPLYDYQASTHPRHLISQMWNTISRINEDMKGDDCFMRAQIWSFKLDRAFNVKSKKVFMHYTDKYNRELDVKGGFGLGRLKRQVFGRIWDFHVAPVVNFEGQDIVIDPKLMDAPKTVQGWVDGLMERGEFDLKNRQIVLLNDYYKYKRKLNSKFATDESRARYRGKMRDIERTLRYLGVGFDYDEKVDIQCKQVEHIAEVDLNQESAWCFYQLASMYYYGPLQLRYLNYGDIDFDKRFHVKDRRFHTRENYENGARYIQRNWNYDEVEESLKEYKFDKRPDSIWKI